MTINWDTTGGLFKRLREIFDILESLKTAQATTIPASFALMLAEYTANEAQRISPAQNSYDTWRRETGFAGGLRTLARNEVIEQVKADNEPESRSIAAALAEVVRQMNEDAPAKKVKENVVSATPTQPSTTVPQVAVSVIGPTGATQQQIVPETITGRFNGGSLTFTSGTALGNKLRSDWPDGSGVSRGGTINTASSGILANGSFDTDAVITNAPDSWDMITGAAGTDFLLSTLETQTVIISGTPTSGTYVLIYTNLDSEVQQTTPLAFNASGASVQAALNALDGLTVSVVTTGTSPNFTHTITFTDPIPAGNQNILASNETFDVGSIAHAQTQAGSAHTHSARSLQLVGDGATLHHIEQAVTLSANTVYAFSMKHKLDAAATGILRIALSDGTGAVVNDDAGTANSVSIDLSSDVSTSAYGMTTAFFRTPATLPSPLYLEIKATTAIQNAKNLFLDDAILVTANTFYPNGPYFAVFDHLTEADGDDEWSIAVANDFAGKIQSWWGRLFGQQLPSDTSGSENIPD